MLDTVCFRPLIGVIISKRSSNPEICLILFVSVPLSGLLFLNNLEMSKNLVMDSFRPLIGVIISKLLSSHIHIETINVSVPLSGLLFLNHGNWN